MKTDNQDNQKKAFKGFISFVVLPLILVAFLSYVGEEKTTFTGKVIEVVTEHPKPDSEFKVLKVDTTNDNLPDIIISSANVRFSGEFDIMSPEDKIRVCVETHKYEMFGLLETTKVRFEKVYL